jgi:superfamily I DNA/RNA helicase
VMAETLRAARMRNPGYDDGDGEAVAKMALEALRQGAGQRYQGIFLDEAQDFGTSALQFVVNMLAPGSDDLVVVADAAQNIFRRRFSWKQAGIQAQGRTRLLKTNYRNTKEILEFAFRFLTAGSLRAEDVPDLDDESAVIPPEAAERSGPMPELRLEAHARDTVRTTVEKVKAWVASHAHPRGVAVLYASNSGPAASQDLARALRSSGIGVFWATDPQDKDARLRLAGSAEPVVLCTVHSAKGLEFPRVVLCEVGRRDDDAETARKLAYVGMTRATTELFVVTETNNPLAGDLQRAADHR